ncbi:UDP-N-acetylmuramate dehydrogenase [Thioclava sp. F36-6]|uniref:UDP-N-acetylmuramate dehydrogenase n=1 Tax=Thioclava sp. F36-6 TaxID=1915316 RepID=UPI00099842B7|nr:UDP-N-acetylmuramate dehydrogenase [Thioclava sp. F36-6]
MSAERRTDVARAGRPGAWTPPVTQSPTPLKAAFDLGRRNTLGLRSQARFGGVLHTEAEIIAAAQYAGRLGLPFHLLGGGSNCVLAEEIDGVVGINGLLGRSVTRASDGVRVTAKAGENSDALVRWTVEQGIGGLENLAGIPGTVGAAPVQNIGAYGVELKDFVESVDIIDTKTWTARRLSARDCGFAYRHSRFKERPGVELVTGVTLRLPTDWQPNLGYAGLAGLPGPLSPDRIMKAVLAQRAAKIPDWRDIGNVGSFFHNPIVSVATARRLADVPGHPVPGGVKLSAARLLDLCGLKGGHRGGAGFSEAHALILVNLGGATVENVIALADHARETVRARFGVSLMQEPALIGR